ncbi:hypothetical protein KP509_03G077100 [Ceratopteris richardii]|uniref:Glycosyltransferase 61 catalytic domain-containing protein n=1 Tax=Ceratopteris richardii TaxID=49495 RepID=A0A8T2V935_CERRI|nr:hypothetical protein KP509_03G077100 [Ceratopteris richardii]
MEKRHRRSYTIVSLLLLLMAWGALVSLLQISNSEHSSSIFSICSSFQLSRMITPSLPSSSFSTSISSMFFRSRALPPYVNASSWAGLLPPPNITLSKLFAERTPTAFPSQFSFMSIEQNPNFTTYVLPYPKEHRQYTLRNVCIEPNGRLLLVNATSQDIGEPDGRGGRKKMPWYWYLKYTDCGNKTDYECVGIRSTFELPVYARYVPGNTLHFMSYIKGNTFHNFAERVWPRLPLSVSPFNDTTAALPVHHFFFHAFEQILREASYMDDKDQDLWQFRMLMEMWPGSDLLRESDDGRKTETTWCFDYLHLQMQHEERIDQTRLPASIYGPALRKYRDVTLRFLGLPVPHLPLPPRPLRVLLHCRTDGYRRRAVNHDEVLNFLLRNFTHLNLEVRSLDLLLRSRETDYSFIRLVTLFSQTDIAIMIHGTVTFGALFMPEGSGVVELFGPCDFWKPKDRYNETDRDLHTWLRAIVGAVGIKHDMSNPFAEIIANPKRGNTTLCIHQTNGVPDFTIGLPKLTIAINSLAYPRSPGDRLTLHWLYDWEGAIPSSTYPPLEKSH